jgi:glycosyltransferase involved in cell wall biosynthesis
MRVAVITPYAGETAETLARCRASVRAQTHSCTHIMIADGSPNAEAASGADQHLVLPRAHGDHGNTPRALGAISAWNQGFDAVAFLDADNWYAPDHVESLVELCRREDLAVAFSDRHVALQGGEVVAESDPEDASRAHADTSCMFFRSRAAFLTPAWAMMDKPLSPICDRIMHALVKGSGLSHGWTGRRTVYYRSLYSYHYARAGRPAPAHPHDVDMAAVLRAYSPDRCAERLGFAIRFTGPASPG